MTLKLEMFGDIERAPRKTWLVKGFLGDGELSSFFGAPGTAKSAIAQDLGCHIAADMEWLGRPVAGGAVLYVAAERAALVRRRLAAWRIFHGIEELPFGLLSGAIDLRSNDHTAKEIIGHANDLRDVAGANVRLVIVDTVSRALAGGDENSPKDMGALVGNVSAIQAATGAHMLLVHHIPADGTQRLRGHGALLGAVDTSVSVEKSASGRTATVEKQNDGEEGETVAFSLQSVEITVDEETGEPTTAPVVIPINGPVVRPTKATRRLPDRHRIALDILKDMCLDGTALPNGGGLPSNIRAVPVDGWRDQLYHRGALEPDHANPRQDFKRTKEALLARQVAAERDGLIWAV